MCKLRQKQKRLTTEEFNLIYCLIRDGSRHPETKPLTGQQKGTREYVEK